MEFVADLGLLALGSRMRALSERLYAVADEVYRLHGIPIQGRWFPLLRLLHDRGPRSVGAIAEAIGQTHSAVSQLADRLQRDGWLRPQAEAGDRRRRSLALTPKAEAALRAAKPAWRAIEDVLQQRCSEAGIDVLGALAGFARVVEAPLADEIVARSLALQRDAVRVVAYDDALRAHFYRLNEAWLRKYFYLEEIDHRVLSDPQREIRDAGGEVFFARVGDAVVGTCALLPQPDGAWELTKMAVDEGHQGLGIGRRLIEAAIAHFRARGGHTLFLETNSRLAPAVRLYESVGFEHQPARKPDSHYQRSNVYMVWRAPGSAPLRTGSPPPARAQRTSIAPRAKTVSTASKSRPAAKPASTPERAKDTKSAKTAKGSRIAKGAKIAKGVKSPKPAPPPPAARAKRTRR